MSLYINRHFLKKNQLWCLNFLVFGLFWDENRNLLYLFVFVVIIANVKFSGFAFSENWVIGYKVNYQKKTWHAHSKSGAPCWDLSILICTNIYYNLGIVQRKPESK